MKKTVVLYLSTVVALFSLQTLRADTIADWTFETTSNSITGTSATIGPIAADGGSGSATGVHSSSATTWSHPAGNGSPSSLSVNTWTDGDYFQFLVDAVNYSDIVVSYDQTRSSTGPATFTFEYSTDGTHFTAFSTDYTVLNNATSVGPPATVAWSATGAYQSAYTFTDDLSSIATLDNAANVYFRVVDDSATGSAGGTGRIDNFLVTGTLEAVPEPSTMVYAALGGVACLLVVRRRL